MRRPYQITGVVLILFAAFMGRESYLLRFYTTLGPGPGFFPLLVSILIWILGTVMLVQATFRISDPMPADFLASPVSYARMGAIVVAMIAVVILMKPIGFRLTMLAFIAFLLLSLGRQNLLITAVLALGGSLGMYHLFAEWLLIPLPEGMFGF